MQIKRITIAGFGKFTQQTWELSAGLQVFYGQNESGKSTLRAFILAILFGLPSRRFPEKRYEPQSTSQYGGSLDLEVDGTLYRLTRIGDQPATLVELTTQTPRPLSLLAHWLAPYDESLYKQLFTFNQAELTALKSLNAADLNQQLQQVGLVGSAPWRTTAEALRQASDELYKPRGRKPELNQALKRYQELSIQVNAAKQRYPEYVQLQAEIQQAQAEQTQLQRDLKKLTSEQQQLANLRNQWPVYQQLQHLQATAPTEVPLSAAVVNRYQQLITKQTELQHTLASARQQLSEQPVDEQSQGLLGFYVQHQTEFDTLESQLAELQQTLGQYQALTAQVATLKATYTAQQQAHPELVACLAPDKQRPLRHLKAALTSAESMSRQQRQPAATAPTKIDWRLIAGGIGIVAGLFLPLGGFKWLLALAGFGLVGWVAWEALGQPTPPVEAEPVETLADQLTAAGLAPDLSVSAALAQLDLVAALQRAQAAVTTGERQAAAQAAKVWQLLQAYEFAVGWLPVDQQHLTASVTRVGQFYEQIHQKLQRQSMAGPDFAYTQRQVQQLTTQVHQVSADLQQLAEANQLADVSALAAKIEAQATQEANAASAAQLAQQLTAAERQALQDYATLADLQTAIARLREQRTTQQTALTQQTAALVTAETQLKRLTEDGRYAALRQEQANLQTEITALAREWLTRQLGAKWIDTALQTLTNQQLPAVLKQASVNFARLTAKRYTEISLNGGTLDLQTAIGEHFTVAELSTATKEQLYLALRFALIDHLGQQAQLPLMIDDGLVNFDDQRKTAAWQLLTTMATDHQLIYFTNETAALTELPAATVHQLA